MKITFDLTDAYNPHDGITVLLKNIISRLYDCDIKVGALIGINEKKNYYKKYFSDNFPNIRNIVIKKTFIPRRFIPQIYNRYLPIGYRKIFNNSDVFVYFYNHIPKSNVMGKKVVVIHDLTPLKIQEYSTKRNLYLNRFNYTIENSDLILTVSEYSKEDIIKTFPQANGKVKVIYSAVDITRFSEIIEKDKQEKVQNKYNLPPKYILFVGQVRENKNLKRLLKAYSALPEAIKNEYGLVYANSNQELKDFAKELKVEKRVRLLNGIEDEDLVAVYKMSSAFALVSLNEGFGTPLIESMGAGVPVICSNISCLPEVVGNAAVLVDPYSEEDIANGLKRILKDNELRKDLIKKGYERIKLFTWENTAQKFKDYLKELIGRVNGWYKNKKYNEKYNNWFCI